MWYGTSSRASQVFAHGFIVQRQQRVGTYSFFLWNRGGHTQTTLKNNTLVPLDGEKTPDMAHIPRSYVWLGEFWRSLTQGLNWCLRNKSVSNSTSYSWPELDLLLSNGSFKWLPSNYVQCFVWKEPYIWITLVRANKLIWLRFTSHSWILKPNTSGGSWPKSKGGTKLPTPNQAAFHNVRLECTGGATCIKVGRAPPPQMKSHRHMQN